MRYFTLSLMLVCSACQSKPVTEKPAASGKATVDVESTLVRLEAQLAYAPRRQDEMESVILLAPKIQECLKAGGEARDPAFSLRIEGKIGKKGEILKPQIKAPSDGLRQCFERDLASVSFGRGRSGPFKLEFVRSKATEDASTKPKGIVIDLSRGKKWQ